MLTNLKCIAVPYSKRKDITWQREVHSWDSDVSSVTSTASTTRLLVAEAMSQIVGQITLVINNVIKFWKTDKEVGVIFLVSKAICCHIPKYALLFLLSHDKDCPCSLRCFLQHYPSYRHHSKHTERVTKYNTDLSNFAWTGQKRL